MSTSSRTLSTPRPRTLLALVLLLAASLTLLAPPAPRAEAAVPAVRPASGVASATALPCGGERPRKANGMRYTCSFEDDFDGLTLDGAKWMVQDTSKTAVRPNYDSCYVDSPKNVSVSGGSLHLTARKEQPFVCASPAGAYTADGSVATVATALRFTQTYGRFEVRARMPRVVGEGYHSALWLYPQTNTYGAWPRSGEIDIAEWYSVIPEYAIPSVHYEGENHALSTCWTCKIAGASDGYHRYAVEWTSSVMRFYFDNVLVYSHRWTPAAPLRAPQPFNRPFYVVLTQVFGHGANAPTATTPPSGTLDVDWVRVWK